MDAPVAHHKKSKRRAVEEDEDAGAAPRKHAKRPDSTTTTPGASAPPSLSASSAASTGGSRAAQGGASRAPSQPGKGVGKLGAGAPQHDVDIDAMFELLGAKKAEQETAGKEAARQKPKSALKPSKSTEAAAISKLEQAGRKANRLRAPDSPTPLRTDPETGMPIYSIEALKIGKGKGDTPLCPFDCECCF